MVKPTENVDVSEHSEQETNKRYGLSPHLFNQEKMTRVSGHVTKAFEVVAAERFLAPVVMSLHLEFSKYESPSENDLALFKMLGIKPILGIPLDARETYAETYSLCVLDDVAGRLDQEKQLTGAYDLDGQPEYKAINEKVVYADSSRPQSIIGVAYPQAGKAVNFEEGLVKPDKGNKRLYITHGIKNCGFTHSGNWSYATGQRTENSPTATEPPEEVFFNALAYKKMREAGVLTCAILPFTSYDEFWFRGKLISGEGIFNVHRATASDVRVNGLYNTNTASDVYPDDIERILSNKELSRDVMLGRITGFLEDVETVQKFNKTHNANYVLGCSAFMKDATLESYTYAFRHQCVSNLAGMIMGDVWHGNPSPQNLTIAGELQDLGECVVLQNGVALSWEGREKINKKDILAFRKGITLSNLESLYEAQGIITSVLSSDTQFYTLEQMWKDVKALLPQKCWAANVSLEDLTGQTAGKMMADTSSPQKIIQKLWSGYHE